MRYRDRDFEYYLICEFRRFLEGRGRDVPHLRRLHFENDDYGHHVRLHLHFHELAEPFCIQIERRLIEHAGWPRRHPTELANSAYSMAIEDHLIEEDRDGLRRRQREMEERGAGPDQIERVHSLARLREQEREAHYRGRTTRPLDALRAEQAEINRLRSRALNILANAPRMIVNRGALDDIEAARQEWARPDGFIEVRGRDPPAVWLDELPPPNNLLTAYAREITREYVRDNIFAAYIGGDFGLADIGAPEAQSRGLELLKSFLTEQQRADYEKHKHFIVIGCDTGRQYRIRHGRQMNIDELGPGALGSLVAKCRWCFLPQGGLVAGDVMLAQKVALENFEKKALKIANRFEA